MGELVVFWKNGGKKRKKGKEKRADGNCIWIIDVWMTFFSAPLTAFNSNGWASDNTYSKFNIKLTFNIMFSPGLEELEEFQFKFSEGTKKNIYFPKAGQSRLKGCLVVVMFLSLMNGRSSMKVQPIVPNSREIGVNPGEHAWECCSVSAYPGWPAAGWWWQRRRSQPSSGCRAPAESNPLVLDQNCPASSHLYSCPSLTWKIHTNINMSEANSKLNVCKLLVAPIKIWKRYM